MQRFPLVDRAYAVKHNLIRMFPIKNKTLLRDLLCRVPNSKLSEGFLCAPT